MGGSRITFVVTEADPNVAVKVTDCLVVTEDVLAVNVAPLDPAVMVTELGTETSADPEESPIVIPPAGATPSTMTVPTLDEPPSISNGSR